MTTAEIEKAPNELQLVEAGANPEGDVRSDSTAIVLPIDDVIVADRYRKELGDLSDLVESIKSVGLMNPITVREWHGAFRLVGGERRLTAMKQLGATRIPARIATEILDIRDALVAERDENTARKEMLHSEKVALAMAIEEMEKPAAMERKAEGQRMGAAVTNGALSSRELKARDGRQSRDAAAEAVDLSPATYTRLKTIAIAASDDAQTENVRSIAQAAMDEIDKGASIRAATEVVKEAKRQAEREPEPVPAASDPAPESDAVDSREARRADINAFHEDLASRYPTHRHAFDAEGHIRYSTLDSFQTAALRAGTKYRFNERTYAKHAAQSQGWLENSSMSLEVSMDVLSNIDFSTITPDQATEALQRIESVPRLVNTYIRNLKEIANG